MAKQEVPKNIRASLYIDGKPAQSSIKDVNQETAKLKRELNQLVIGTEEWNKKLKQVQQNEKYLKSVRSEVRGVGDAFSNMSSKIGKVGGLLGIGVGISGMVSTFQKVISANAELSDAMAGVAKTTGLSQDALERLNVSLKNLDTRTAKSELLGLAEVAGRLGITAENDILGFVRAADKIGVALGTELGGTEEAVKSLGKLADIFKQTELYGIEDSLLKIGSAINDLGMAGTANEGYMVDFAQRLAGVAPAANISLTDVLGLATTLDELGQSAESSSTAIGQFIVGLGADVPKFAKLVGLPAEEFSKLLRDDAMGAFRMVLQASSSVNGGIQALATNMGDLGVTGNRGIAAIGALAENIDILKARQDQASQSFKDGTSIITEFDAVNTTLAANLQKIQNNLAALWENSRFRNWLTDVTGSMVNMNSESNDAADAFLKQKAAVEENEKALNPLINRYDELKAKNKLSNDEHVEFRDLIQKIGELMPGVITQYDQYGTAVDINASKVRELTKAQRELLLLREEEAVLSLQQSVRDNLRKSEDYSNTANDLLSDGPNLTKYINETARIFTKNAPIVGKWFPVKDAKEFSSASKLALGEAYDEAVILRDEFGLKLAPEIQKIVDGFEKVESIAPKIKVATDSIGGRGKTGSQDKKKEAAAKKRAERELKDTEKLQADLKKINEDIFLNSLEASDKEVEANRLKYQKLRDQAKGNQSQIDEINRLEGEEAIAIMEKITAAAEEESNKQYLAKKDAVSKIEYGLMSADEMELDNTRQKYMSLLEMADAHGLEKTDIINRWAEEDIKIKERQEKEKAEIEQRNNSKWKLSDKEYEQEKKDFAIQMASEAASATFDVLRSSNQAKLDASINSIERERDAELSNKNLTEDQKKRINDKYDARIREEKKRAWKADQAASIAQAVVNGALAVTKVMAQTGILSPFAIPAIVAGTAIQIATIASQKAPEYAVGGFSDKDPAGYVSNSTLFNRSSSGRPFVAGEAGKEWIAPNWMVNSPKYANIIGMLESARQEKRFFAGGGSTEVSSLSNNSSQYNMSRLEGLMSETVLELRKIKDLRVVLEYKTLEDKKAEIDYTRSSQGRK